MLLFIDRDWIIFKVEEYFDLAISWIFMIAFDNAFFEVSIESKDMPIEMNPVRLIELRAISTDILRVEMIVSCRDKWCIVHCWFLVSLLSGKGVSSGFLFVDISILLLLNMTHFFEVLFELLSGSEAW